MKKAVNYLSLIVCSSLFVLSCQSISLSNEEESAQPEGRTFTCVFAQPDPEAKVDVNLSTGKTTWEVGDKILINAGSGGTSRRTVTLTAGDIFDEGKKAIITIPGDLSPYVHKSGGVQDVTSTYYALYPADNVASGSLYYNQAFSDQNDFLMAACNVGDTFVFFNLCGVIAYTVNDGEDYDFDQVAFSGRNGETVAYDTYQARVWDKGSGAVVASYAKSADSYNPLVPRTSCTNTVVSDGSTMNYIFLPGGTNFTTGFTFSFLSGGVIKKTATANAAKNVAPGKILKLGDISSHLEDYVAPTKHDNTIEVDVASAYDLSASATANCYLLDSSTELAANKTYKFKAAKGKGGDVLTNIGGDEDKDVVVLWETVNTSVAPSVGTIISAVDYDQQEGKDAYIVFKMPASITPGNAVIAAKSAAGVILWSWHIWVPASDVTSSQYGLGGQTWMDRNLGALTVAEASAESDVAASSLGLFYAWGRKDPFPGPASAGSESNPIATTGTFSYTGGVMAHAADSYASPMTFVATGSDENQYWAEDNSSALWGTSKTINDPCPPGYVVPQYKSGEGVWNGAGATGFAFNSTHKWVKMGSGSYIVFPIIGFLDGCQDAAYIRYSSRTYIWSSTWNNTNTARPLRLNLAGTSSTSSERQARGFSVRCVAE